MSEEESLVEEEQNQEDDEENQEENDESEGTNDDYEEIPFDLGQIKYYLGRFSKNPEETKNIVTNFVENFNDLEEEENEKEDKKRFFDNTISHELNMQKGKKFLDLYHRFCIIQKVCQIAYNEYQNMVTEIKIDEVANNIIQILKNDRNPKDSVSEEYILFFENIKKNNLEYIQSYIQKMIDYSYHSTTENNIADANGVKEFTDILKKFQDPKDKNLICILYLKLLIDSYRFFIFYSTYIQPLIPYFSKTGDSKLNMIQQVLCSFEKLIIPQNTLANNIYTNYLSDYKVAETALKRIKEISNDQGKAIEQSSFHYLLKDAIIYKATIDDDKVNNEEEEEENEEEDTDY